MTKPTGNRRGRPVTIASTEWLRLRIPADLLAELQDRAGRGGVSAFVIAAIREALASS